jgi:hypothetical protein
VAEKKENTQAQIEGLATLLVLDDEIKRLSNIREFGFFSTNETHRLISYHTAYLWEKKELLGVHLVAQSGTAEFDPHTSINLWLKEKIQILLSSEDAAKTHALKASDIETNFENDWPESLPQNFLWCPFTKKQQEPTGGLIFFREEPFTEAEIKMLRWLISSYQYTWNILIKPKAIDRWQIFKTKPYFTTLIIVFICFLLFPVRLSVIGNGIVVAKDPALINDEQKLTQVPLLEAQLAIDRAQLDYTKDLLNKTEIRSPIDGIVIFDSTEDWIGQPVQTGERILSVADIHKLKLRISLPVTERITLKVDDPGDFFMSGQLSKIPVKIATLGYNAKLTPNKILSYEMEANFVNPDDLPQIGSQGTVKLYGRRVPLFYYLIRRPLQATRNVLGI